MSNNPHGTVLDKQTVDKLRDAINGVLDEQNYGDVEYICVVVGPADDNAGLNIDMVSGVPFDEAMPLLAAIVGSSEKANVVNEETIN